MDYSLFYRRTITINRLAKELGKFDFLLSAYNSSDRVRIAFENIEAQKKIWLIHPEYQYLQIEYPKDGVVVGPQSADEIAQIEAAISVMPEIESASICIDITGFMRHSLAFLIPKLEKIGVKRFTAIYSEPISYTKQEETQFATTTSDVVRPIRGMYGSPGAGQNHLIMAIGYDHKLVGQVFSYKDGVITHPLFAFPSLSADMYQQSALRAEKSGEIVLKEDWVNNRFFSPANDPFSTASIISERVRVIDKKGAGENIFLSPLSTKAQVLGMSLYWLLEGRHRGRCSVILPECVTYSRETSTGLKRLWAYLIRHDPQPSSLHEPLAT
jgi:hypothetical protein